jgi:hypothetical protein
VYQFFKKIVGDCNSRCHSPWGCFLLVLCGIIAMLCIAAKYIKAIVQIGGSHVKDMDQSSATLDVKSIINFSPVADEADTNFPEKAATAEKKAVLGIGKNSDSP